MTDKFKQEMKDLRAAALEDECQEQEAEMMNDNSSTEFLSGVDEAEMMNEMDILFPTMNQADALDELYNRG